MSTRVESVRLGSRTSVVHCRGWIALALVLAASFAAPGAHAREWLANPTVDRDSTGWRARVVPGTGAEARRVHAGGRGSSAALWMRGAGPDSSRDFSVAPVWGSRLDSIPAGRRMHLRVWVRGEHCTLGPVLGLHALGADRKPLAYASTEDDPAPTGTFDWRPLECTLDVPAGTVRVDVVVGLLGRGDVWLDDCSVVDEGASPRDPARRVGLAPPVDSCRVYELRGSSRILAPAVAAGVFDRRPRVRLQIVLPRLDAQQAPLDFDLWTGARTELSAATVRTAEGGTTIAEVELIVPAEATGTWRSRRPGAGVQLEWRSHVLVLPDSVVAWPTGETGFGSPPDEAKPWLKPTACVQVDDPRIVEVASRLRSESRDARALVRRTLAYVDSINQHAEPRSARFDAVSALTCPGSCVSHANLAAALLRANGIPARLVCGVPTWAPYSDMHALVEAWMIGVGWVRMDPSRNLVPVEGREQLVTVVAAPADEDAGRPDRPGTVGCVPWLSMFEFVPPCEGCEEQGVADPVGATHRVTCSRTWASTPRDAHTRAVVRQAETRWQAWIASEPAASSDGHLRTPFDAESLLNPGERTGRRRQSPTAGPMHVRHGARTPAR